MRRLAITLVGCAATLGIVLAPPAGARRLASAAQRAAVGHAVEGARFPAGCGVVYISTVASRWSSFQWVGDVRKAPRSCQRYAADGIVLLHLASGRWHVVSAGSHFDCPIAGREVNRGQPNVPDRVANDLVPYLHCR